jgi:hypothetical protein
MSVSLQRIALNPEVAVQLEKYGVLGGGCGGERCALRMVSRILDPAASFVMCLILKAPVL